MPAVVPAAGPAAGLKWLGGLPDMGTWAAPGSQMNRKIEVNYMNRMAVDIFGVIVDSAASVAQG